MARTQDQQEKKRARDMKTVSQMIALYCAGHHGKEQRTQTAFCGEAVCPDCGELDAYAHMRTEACPFMATKVSCDRCEAHCYTTEELDRIKAVMRYSGPRMMLHHPIAALRHLTGK